MDSDYKMSQTATHEFAIHDKLSGALRATITREPAGTWSTHPHDPQPVTERDAPGLDDQKSPQAAFNAFVSWANGTAD